MITSKQNAEHYIWGDQCDGWHLLKQQDLSIIHERMPAHTAETRHSHEKSQQYFFVLEGTATIEIAGESFELKTHEGIHVKPNTPHQMYNRSSGDIQFLVISEPTTRGDRFPA
ncbi:cupin domain-containing protein [Paenibacillus glycanilyticus]|uniref:Cupin n=1 Tax=Paenibacillus glycanilyticus TaxID=126569 RepID=A0ABQ6GBJ8_9BACL|nr:cupin domain-containing protein [Paenibacillus glycanilyticus]GLX68326.1 cupin [Paenibacillus glycanilyticus]